MLLTGFPAGMLACNCYVLAPHAGADAIVVDPGQRAFAPLRRILDENRLTPAAVLLTHGHIDHIWSAHKVADTFGCPVYIHPADRHMLTDPIRGFGPRIGQIALGALFREPKQVVDLDRDGQVLDLGGIGVTVDHTPGHTRGSVVFRVCHHDDAAVFTGDTLFEQIGGAHGSARWQRPGPARVDPEQTACARRRHQGATRPRRTHDDRNRTAHQPLPGGPDPVNGLQSAGAFR